MGGAELRHTHVLRASLKLSRQQTLAAACKNSLAAVSRSARLVAELWALDGHLLDLLADAPVTLGQNGGMTVDDREQTS